MKKRLVKITLGLSVVVFALVYFVSPTTQASPIVYDFESDTVGQAPSGITAVNGTSIVETGKVITIGAPASGNTTVLGLDLFPSAADYSVTWKENYDVAGRTGIIMRGFGSNPSNPGATQGYLLQINPNTNDVRIYQSNSDGYQQPTEAPTATLTAPGNGVDRWYRATAQGDVLSISYSTNGTDFIEVMQHTDTAYQNAGTTQFVRGYGQPATGTRVDDITFVNNDVVSNTISVNNISDYQIFQRDAMDEADITISGTYTGEPTAIEASFDGSSWVTVDASPTGGTFSGIYSDAQAGQGTLSVRFTNDTDASDDVNFVGVGDIFVISGQSNASGRGSSNQVYTHPTLTASLFGNDDNWKELADPTDSNAGQADTVSSDSAGGSVWPLVATQIMASQNVPVAFIPTAKGGTRTSQWQPAVNNSDPSTLYGSMNRRIAAVGGKVAGVLWFQGESDATNGTTATTYQTELENIVDTLNSNFPGTKTFIGQIGHSSYAGNDTVRGAQVQTALDNPNAFLVPATYDINLSDEGGDTLHFRSNGDLQLFADRWFAAINKELYGGADGYGPVLNTLLYNSAENKVLATFDDESTPVIDPASTVTPDSFILRNNGIEVTVSSVVINGDTVELTPASALNTAQSITLSYASLNDAVDRAIYDSIGLPAQPFYNEPLSIQFEVNFLDYDSTPLTTQAVTEGNDAVAPTDPTRTGYTFTGWNPADLTNITADTDFTAQYAVNEYTLTFDTDGGSAVASISEDFGTAIAPPAAPTKSGYTFTGWSPSLPATMPASSATHTAQWDANEYTLTFDTDGGSAVAALTQDYGTAITAPTAPMKTGYTFTGWSPSLPATMPASSATHTAQWDVVETSTSTTTTRSGGYAPGFGPRINQLSPTEIEGESLVPEVLPTTREGLMSLVTKLQTFLLELLKQVPTSSGSPTTPETPTINPPLTNPFTRDLEFSAQGDDVRRLQELLISKGYSIPSGATGYFGFETQAAVISYQEDNDIAPAAGYFGSITRGVLGL